MVWLMPLADNNFLFLCGMLTLLFCSLLYKLLAKKLRNTSVPNPRRTE